VSTIVYQIPLAHVEAYRGRRLIVRSDRPSELVARLGEDDLGNLAYIQLHSLPKETDVLIHWAEGLAVDLLLEDPAADFARLYHYAKLLDNHPVRVTLPVRTGFEQAARLASSLQFAVRLQIGQPTAELIEKLARLLDDYLHRPTMTQPIELFHSLLLGLCHAEPVSLWAIQEEDPALIRYVDDDGAERLPGKLADAEVGSDPAGFVGRWGNDLLTEGTECAECPFFGHCQGYFKWPRREYDCAGVKVLFQTLARAADELRGDLAAVPSPGDAGPP
jgi:hypothetical protein